MIQRVGRGRVLGEVDGVFDLLASNLLHPLILAILECSARKQLIPVDRDRILLRHAFELGTVSLRIALEVTPQTQGVHLNERRDSPRARTRDGRARGSVGPFTRVVFHPHSGPSVSDRAVGYGM